MSDFLMPALGADMTEGTLVAWCKKPGEPVHRGETIAQVDTAKGVIDVEAFVDGVVEEFLVVEGQTVPVGTPMARIRDAEGKAAPVTAAPLAGAPPSSASAAGKRVAISPLARKLAAELGVDPASIAGSGPGGAVTKEDVERAAASRTGQVESDRGARMRQVIASAMSRSKREIPHYYLGTTIDMHAASAWLQQENERRPIQDRLLYGVLLVKAVALALREFPELNGYWTSEGARPSDAIHVGVAISLRQGGLVAPALHHTDQKSVDDLMKSFRDLVNRVRAGSLRSSELTDATITVTSLGDQGVETVFGVIYPPQVALVGFGKLAERPWCVGGQVVPRPVIEATLSADHRTSDGHRGARFLAAVDRLLQEPEKL
jgi:pyruvate dehydrogenase E2 component (dihydrolipoamide acetyltransferase)